MAKSKRTEGEDDMDPLPPMKKTPDPDDGEDDMDAPGIAGYAAGGRMSFSEEVPWFERQEENAHQGSGFLHSSVAGRTDRLPVAVAADSYVIPADVVSGLGQGNSLSGARVLNEALKTGPWGTNVHVGSGRSDAPHAPAPLSQSIVGDTTQPLATGGKSGKMPIMVAGGEHIVEPEAVERLGRAKHKDKKLSKKDALTAGHRCLDELVKRVRAHTVKTIKKLPPPKR